MCLSTLPCNTTLHTSLFSLTHTLSLSSCGLLSLFAHTALHDTRFFMTALHLGCRFSLCTCLSLSCPPHDAAATTGSPPAFALLSLSFLVLSHLSSLFTPLCTHHSHVLPTLWIPHCLRTLLYRSCMDLHTTHVRYAAPPLTFSCTDLVPARIAVLLPHAGLDPTARTLWTLGTFSYLSAHSSLTPPAFDIAVPRTCSASSLFYYILLLVCTSLISPHSYRLSTNTARI